MGQIVRIIADKPLEYSHDNGITKLQYLPGQIYEIPERSVPGMAKRKAIELLDRKEVDEALASAQPAGSLTGEGEGAGSEGGDPLVTGNDKKPEDDKKGDEGNDADDKANEPAKDDAKADTKADDEAKAKAKPADDGKPSRPTKS